MFAKDDISKIHDQFIILSGEENKKSREKVQNMCTVTNVANAFELVTAT